jgi:transposase-like protein
MRGGVGRHTVADRLGKAGYIQQKRTRRQISPSQLAKLCREYTENGKNLRELSDEFGLSRPTIKKYLTEAGVAIRQPEKPPTFTPAEVDDLRRQYEQLGMTIHGLAAERRVRKDTVRAALLSVGVQLRGPSRTPWTPKDTEIYGRLYRDNAHVTLRSIAEERGVPVRVVAAHLTEAGIPLGDEPLPPEPARRTKRTFTPEEAKELRGQYEQTGISVRQLADANGVSAPTMSRVLRSAGTQIRTGPAPTRKRMHSATAVSVQP